VQFRESKLADAIDGDKQIELAFLRPDLGKIDVDVPQWICLEPLALRLVLRMC